MREYTSEELKAMTLREVQVEISNRVYACTGFLEDLEHAKKIFGNGHHMRQIVAKYAEDLIEQRWINDIEARCIKRKEDQGKENK